MLSRLGKPTIAETCVDEWNRDNPRYTIKPAARQLRLDGEVALEDEEATPKEGDRLLQQLNRYRGVLQEPNSWPPEVRQFDSKWKRYKSSNNLMDFCDLIENALRDISTAPGDPSFIAVDESQDLNPMQLALLRRWGQRAHYSVFAGDDDQTIFAWLGASAEALINPDIPKDHKVFLQQSRRVPRTIHSLSLKLVSQITRRQEKTYLPRPADGAVHRLPGACYRCPEYSILKSAERHLRDGKSIMFLASCSYMLRPIVAVLRKNAIPFHNPYRNSNGFWNPLRTTSRDSAANRILALLVGASAERWTIGELKLWVEWLRGDLLRSEARAACAAIPAKHKATTEILGSIFHPEPHESLLTSVREGPRSLLEWWQKRLGAEFRKRALFPADIAAVRGHDALRNSPQIVIGTVHSVKGGQADIVYLFTDLSRSGDAQYRRDGPARDSVIRVFYVGTTRARETLYLCGPGTSLAVSI